MMSTLVNRNAVAMLRYIWLECQLKAIRVVTLLVQQVTTTVMPTKLVALGALSSILWKLINIIGIQLCTSVMIQLPLVTFQVAIEMAVANRFTVLTQLLMVLARTTKSTHGTLFTCRLLSMNLVEPCLLLFTHLLKEEIHSV